MTPYVESGLRAARRIKGETVEVRRCMQRLRAFRQVINAFCVSGMACVALSVLATGSAETAISAALPFLLLVWMLEVAERKAKRELAGLRNSAGGANHRAGAEAPGHAAR